jgi:hypothetical protein
MVNTHWVSHYDMNKAWILGWGEVRRTGRGANGVRIELGERPSSATSRADR